MAIGFCTCKRDFPQRRTFHPPAGASWHFLCDKPVLPCRTCGFHHPEPEAECPWWAPEPPAFVPTGTGWPVAK